MIQIITYEKSKYENIVDDYKISALDEFESFDDYDINIIDLSDEDMWRFSGSNYTSLNNISDLKTLSRELRSMKKSKIIVVFPQNCEFYYEKDFQGKYRKSIKLKDILPTVIDIISKNLFNIIGFDISYSKNKTQIENSYYNSDFNFNEVVSNTFTTITNSNNSKKNTTILYNNLIITTLNIFETKQHLSDFLSPLQINIDSNEVAPDWLTEINFYDDELLKKNKEENNNKIKNLQEKNDKIDKKLEKNNKIKSILYTTGDELVGVIMELLDDMLENDSSNFADDKKEDFLIKKQDITFIGEIKGISSAVSNKNVSQLDVHVQGYNDKIIAEGIEEKVKGILVINHQRNKKISERNEVHTNQIDLAIRNGSLIIESNILLSLYEKYLKQELSSNEIIKILSEKTGVLTQKDLNNNKLMKK